MPSLLQAVQRNARLLQHTIVGPASVRNFSRRQGAKCRIWWWWSRVKFVERAIDWNDVTLEDLMDALKEVDWSIPPRPLGEFFDNFSVPNNDSKWEGRLQCNVYYYRTNYLILMGSVFVIAFVRNPLALGAVTLTGLNVACLNDSFAMTLNQKLMRVISQISPPLERKLQAPKPQAPVTKQPQGRPRKRAVYICGQERRICVGALASVPMLHASFRTPNVKSRLSQFQKEFRAALRGFKDS